MRISLYTSCGRKTKNGTGQGNGNELTAKTQRREGSKHWKIFNRDRLRGTQRPPIWTGWRSRANRLRPEEKAQKMPAVLGRSGINVEEQINDRQDAKTQRSYFRSRITRIARIRKGFIRGISEIRDPTLFGESVFAFPAFFRGEFLFNHERFQRSPHK
jgi:hypothetical protein